MAKPDEKAPMPEPDVAMRTPAGTRILAKHGDEAGRDFGGGLILPSMSVECWTHTNDLLFQAHFSTDVADTLIDALCAMRGYPTPTKAKP